MFENNDILAPILDLDNLIYALVITFLLGYVLYFTSGLDTILSTSGIF